ncbi:hypothetical protein [Catenulispora rubra]|uniref:hypothetical protein n=1 Tax=Catenulispora rubra TaxID=280293 RepID=UPI00189236AD|nr:hypothetical protein [Catenulispora rubra]
MNADPTGGREPGAADEAREPVSEPTPEPAPEDDLVLATARRIIAADAAIIHRLGTI